MENIYDRLGLALGHKALFFREISTEEIIEIISKYPTSQWLDLAAKIEGFILVERDNIPKPQIYLSNSIFPKSTLDRIKKQLDKDGIYFAQGQLNLVRKMAIVYGSTNETENLFSSLPSADISKVLLGVHDLHNRYDEIVCKEGDLDNFCQFIIRNGYLNGPLLSMNLFVRGYNMYLFNKQQTVFPPYLNFADFFTQKVGMTIEQAMAINLALSNPFFQNEPELAGQPTVIDPKKFFKNLLIDNNVINSIIDGLAIDLSEAKEKIVQEFCVPDIGSTPVGYNLAVFRKTPLIRLNDGKLICVSLSCLLEKLTQNIIWFPKHLIPSLTKEQSDQLINFLTDNRGQLFHKYIKELCKIMVEKNSNILFYNIPPQETVDHQEVGDSILVQGNKILIIEAKSRQFNEEFKYTGDWTKDEQFIEELVKKATLQIQVAAKKIMSGRVPQVPILPNSIKKIYPVIITYEPIPMHAKMQRFIRKKVLEFSHLTDPIFSPLEIIEINDLEQFIDVSNSFTIIDILEKKEAGGQHASETNFRNFFYNFIKNNNVLSNGWQKSQSDKFYTEIVKVNLPFKAELSL